MKNFYGLNLKNLLEKAPVGVIIHRWDTCIVYANPTALRLFGLTFDQIIGKDTFDPKWSFVDENSYSLTIILLTK